MDNRDLFAREAAVKLFMKGQPTLGEVVDATQHVARERDRYWRNRMDHLFCERPHGEMTCEEAYQEWWRENSPESAIDPYSDGCPRHCNACLKIRGRGVEHSPS